VVYPGEAHGLGRDKNMFDLYGRVERFLAKYLTANTQMEPK
jgi:dipeptidyl aminopeptidase/acylaminoacyl peptidase